MLTKKSTFKNLWAIAKRVFTKENYGPEMKILEN